MEGIGEIMKNLCIAFFVIFISVLCGQSAANEKDYVFDENSIIIDVRTEKEYNGGHLSNSTNIPHGEIKEKIEEHVKGKEKEIVLYCRTGRRSGIVEKILNEMGYVNVINAGAYEKLRKKEAMLP